MTNNNFDTINITEIAPSTYNPRQISNTEYNKLSNSISEFGVISPIIVNLKNNHIIGGHMRYDALYDEYLSTGEYEELQLIRLGDIGWVFPSTDLTVKDLSTEKAMNLALNKISGEWDIPKLENLLIDLDVEEYDLDLTGFDNMDLQEFDIDLKHNIKIESPQEKLSKTLEKEKSRKSNNSKSGSTSSSSSNTNNNKSAKDDYDFDDDLFVDPDKIKTYQLVLTLKDKDEMDYYYDKLTSDGIDCKKI